MPFTLRVDEEAGIAIATCSGVIKLADAKQGAGLLWGGPASSGLPVLCDLREAQMDFPGTDIREIARFILENQPPKPIPRLAIVTSRDLEFGLARMFEAWRENRATDVRIFRDYDEAVRWARSPETSTD